VLETELVIRESSWLISFSKWKLIV
jgi:hypothetical protein